MNHVPPPPDPLPDYAHKIQNGYINNSPATNSPTTPVSNLIVPDVKIDMDFQEQESDVRHEPLPVKSIDTIDKNDDQDPIPIQDSTSPTPDDVKMSEELINGSVTVRVNGHTNDVQMVDTDSQTPGATPGISGDFSMVSIDGSSTSVTRSFPDDGDENGEPPAKRARMLSSDVDMRDTTHSATPPPASAAISTAASPVPQSIPSATLTTSVPPTTSATSQQSSTLSAAQHRFCLSTIRTLKKMKDAGPFLRPVDIVGLNIPHYPSIIKTPMDLSTIDRKLVASHPIKPDPNEDTPRYYNTDEFIADVRLIFQNAATFNGPDHVVTAMGKRLQDVFDKQLKNLPASERPKPSVVKKMATPTPVPVPSPTPAPAPVPPKKAAQPAIARRPSTSVPIIRRSEAEAIGRPKREIHPPPPKDLPYADAPKKQRKTKRIKDDGTIEQLKYCGKILQELHRKQHYNYAHPFYEPVDWVKMDLPTYPKVIKKPMDLATIRRKLDNHEYTTAHRFYDDFKLMIRNCFLFNPSGTPVNLAGIELQRLFDEKWKHLPPLHEASEEEEEEEEESEEEHQPLAGAISLMENQIKAMHENLAALKNAKLPKEKKKKEKKRAPVASTSKAAPTKPPKSNLKKKTKKNITDDDILTFEQKKDLSESISKLEGSKLEKVIQIIHEGVPEIRDSTEEIELEIDQLPAAVLTKLYNYVLRPLRQPAQPKRNRTGKGTGTGGLKRKSMDEDKEAEKIRLLEERMLLFENRGGASAAATAPHVRREADSGDSSASSSDSSGSDSE